MIEIRSSDKTYTSIYDRNYYHRKYSLIYVCLASAIDSCVREFCRSSVVGYVIGNFAGCVILVIKTLSVESLNTVIVISWNFLTFTKASIQQ